MKPRLVTELSGADGATTIGPEVWRQVVSPDVAGRDQGGHGPRGRGRGRAACSRPAPRCPGSLTAGKSGTAQLDGSAKPHSWFIGFAPANDPQIAIAVIVESGGRRDDPGVADRGPADGPLLRLGREVT